MTAQKELDLPSPYKPVTKVSGHIGFTHHELQLLASPTAGTTTAYVVRISYGKWKEIGYKEWLDLATKVVGNHLKPIDYNT